MTRLEMMLMAAAREIRDGDVVFVGMRLPLQAFALAQRTHAPNAVGLFECGIVRNAPPVEPIVTMADPPNVRGAQWVGGMTDLMGLLAQGRVDVGLLGGAQLDRYGNLNTSYIGGYVAPQTRLPGSGGASDIASLARRTVILMNHEKRRFVEEVDYITSPGHGTGAGWREGAGLPRREGSLPFGGTDAVISTLGVFRFDDDGEMVLVETFPGVTVEEVRQNTGWELKVSDALRDWQPPV
ncbi:MAG: CoA-transferase [Chloroflexota bacterium]|nr:CoA-transferase [Chloroflexota bacterium]